MSTLIPKQNVMGKYLVYFDLSSEYTITGGDAEGVILSDGERVTLYVSAGVKGSYMGNTAAFLKNNKIFIKRFRFIPMGGYGCRVPPGRVNSLKLEFVNSDGEKLCQFASFRNSKWEEWTNCNVTVEPFENDTVSSDYHVYLETKSSSFRIEDFNVQPAYIGKKIKVRVEMEVETSGVDVYQGGVV